MSAFLLGLAADEALGSCSRGAGRDARMHGCCQGSKGDWERNSFDPSREQWHYNNAWFASRGYVVLNYTARGFRSGTRGSTGQSQLDSRLFEINDFQYLAGSFADDPFFN